MLQVAQRFTRLIARIQPLPNEVRQARAHFLQVRARLSTSFIVSKIVPIGSHAKHTAVRSVSDVDVLAVLRRREARWGGSYVTSETFLRRVRDDLVARYPATLIRRDGQAVVIGFGQGKHRVDVVPAIYHRPSSNGYPIYSIPDGLGGWLETAPDIHAAYFQQSDRRSGGKLGRVVQMLKLWAQWRATPLPLLSFHLEMLLASSRVAEQVMPYSRAVALSFALLNARSAAALRDPTGISGLILAADTEAKRELLVRAIGFASEHATAAFVAERHGDSAEAVRQWRIVFGEWFPRSLA